MGERRRLQAARGLQGARYVNIFSLELARVPSWPAAARALAAAAAAVAVAVVVKIEIACRPQIGHRNGGFGAGSAAGSEGDLP